MRFQPRRLWLVVIMISLFAGITATSLAGANSEPVEKPAGHDRCDRHPHPASEQRKLAKQVFAYRNWQSPSPGKGAVKTMKVLRGCVKQQVRKKMAKSWKHFKSDLYLQQRYREVATFPGLPGEGRFLQWLVIPAWVVEAETSECSAYGNTLAAGECRWVIVNTSGSGACGPYQLLGHTSCDTSSPADKLRHHEVAASLPRGSWEVGY